MVVGCRGQWEWLRVLYLTPFFFFLPHSRKNFKLLSGAGIFWLFWSRTHTFDRWEYFMPFCSGHFLGQLFHSGLSSKTDLSCFPLLASPLASSRTSQATWQSTHSLSLLPSSRKDQPTWETTFTLLHWLFFTDSLSHISSSPLSTMWRPHQIYGPLVSGKSFFYHSSFLLNHWILGETNWIFSTPVLTSAF